jgi:hypothetical protein
LESLKGKTVLLYAEQGLGDTIQFSRYISSVYKLGAKIILEVQPPLVILLSHLAEVSLVVAYGDKLPKFDYQCPLLSLPLAFKTESHSIPTVSKQIKIDAEKVNKWRSQLGPTAKPRVGLVWSGSTTHKNDRNRSLTLTEILPYLPSNFEYICLQKEIRDVDKALLKQCSEIKFFGGALEDFTDTAALCDLMDIIISVDTSIAHLAASRNLPTWILLPCSPDWRWLLNSNTSAWYPSVKLYRQDKICDWSNVLEKLSHDLKNYLENLRL